MKHRKLTAGLTAAVLMLSSTICGIPAETFSCTAIAAESGTLGDSLTYTLDDAGVLTVSGTGAWNGTFPDAVRESVTAAVITDGITEIGAEAFKDCTALEKAEIPDSVTSIAAGAFSGCTALADIRIPYGVTDFGMDAFTGTAWLKKRQEADPLVTVNGILIDGRTARGHVDIPCGVVAIAPGAFKGAVRLNTVVIPESVSRIGAEAFCNCISLSIYQYSSRVTEIEPRTYAGCRSLMSVVIPPHVTRIGEGAFAGCTGLANVRMQEGLKEIGADAFRQCSMEHVKIPNSVTDIGEGAFAECASLEMFILPNAECRIGGSASTISTALDTADGHDVYSCTGTIYGHDGSTAQKYAEQFGYPFISVDPPESALSGMIGDNLTWTLDPDGLLTVSGKGTWSRELPLEIRQKIRNVVIEENVANVIEKAFVYCCFLQKVTVLSKDCYFSLDYSILQHRLTDQIVVCSYYDSSASVWAHEYVYPFELYLTSPVTSGTLGEHLTWTLYDNGVLVVSGKGKWDPACAFPAEIRDQIISVVLEDGVKDCGTAFRTCSNLENITFLDMNYEFANNVSAFPDGITICGYSFQKYGNKFRYPTSGDYAKAHGIPFIKIGSYQPYEPNPDMNGDESVTAADAQIILCAYAEMLAGNPSGLTAEQEAAADVDRNGEINALDAQYSLIYYLYFTVLQDFNTTWDAILQSGDGS